MKNIKKVVTVMCIVAVIGGAYAVMHTPRTSTRRPEEVQKNEPTNKSQAKPEIKTTTEDTPKVEASHTMTLLLQHMKMKEQQRLLLQQVLLITR